MTAPLDLDAIAAAHPLDLTDTERAEGWTHLWLAKIAEGEGGGFRLPLRILTREIFACGYYARLEWTGEVFTAEHRGEDGSRAALEVLNDFLRKTNTMLLEFAPAPIYRANRARFARIRELEAALATATQTERARCLAICRNRQHARSNHSRQLREEGSHDRSIWVHCKSTEAAACADEIERGYIPPTQETT